MKDKMRLDTALVERGLEESREKAKALIMSGIVYVDGEKIDKAGAVVTPDSNIEIRGKKLAYVSRGGLKLEKAMAVFDIELKGKTCMDIGASTGGFTDCMLKNGAAKVYAVDVGYGQLAWSLRTDERVINLERTNIRYIDKDKVDPLDFVSVDVSFISLALVLPVMYDLMKDGAEAVCLVKPQFEAGRDKVGKKGVVRELSTHIEVLEKACSDAYSNKFEVIGLDFSPVKGPEGNIEYLMFLKKSNDPAACKIDAAFVASQSHKELRS